jgi:UDP-3-O-[3-hydroxymyristoyl] glucosamine N-acyltransferase
LRSQTHTLAEIARILGGELSGDGKTPISGVAGIKEAKTGDITFVARPEYRPLLQSTGASAVIVPRGMECAQPAIYLDDPYLGFIKVLNIFAESIADKQARGVDATAVVDADAELGRNVSLGPHCQVRTNARIGDNTTILMGTYIGEGVAIGRDCLFYPNVTIAHGSVIGDRVIIHPGVVIGSDGFGFAREGEIHHKIPQIGNVVVEDDVEIGSNSAVDRATTGTTRIGAGTKIDNLVHVAHNVTIGRNSLMAGQSGIAGSTELGDSVTLAGQSGVADHLTIGDHVVLAAKSAVFKSVPSGVTLSGIPARDHVHALKLQGYTSRLPALRQRIRELEERIEHLEKGGAHGQTTEND